MANNGEFLANADREPRQDDLLEHDAIWLDIGESSSGHQRPPFAATSAADEAAVCVWISTFIHEQGTVGDEHRTVATGHTESVVQQESLEFVFVAVQVGLAVDGFGEKRAEPHYKQQLVLRFDRLRVTGVLLYGEVKNRQLVLVCEESVAQQESVLLQALRHQHRHVFQLQANVLT